MSQDRSVDLAIVGGGIVGLAHAYHALKRGLRVALFEREQFAIGASVRNFGMVWPIGQAPGEGLSLALSARKHWIDITREAGIWINPNGSLHLAYHQDEWDVLNEFVSLYPDAGYEMKLLSRDEVLQQSPAVNGDGLIGALWSGTECIINSRKAIRRFPVWLEERFGLRRVFGETVRSITLPIVETTKSKWTAQQVIVCSGADFETLYPEVFQETQITRCKLQMLKAAAPGLNVGPSLCAGLTLRHYAAFGACPSLKRVDQRYDESFPAYKEFGIHVLLSQNNAGELIIGDSHQYGLTLDPFNTEEIDRMILDYLHTFLKIDNLQIIERWNGTYPKLPGKLNLITSPEPDVTIVNGLGGAGMTLSLGVAEKVIASL